jgi:LAGLIDADG endonuclease
VSSDRTFTKVTTCRVRKISRKGWIATSLVTLTGKEASPSRCNAIRAAVSVFSSFLSFHVSQNGDRAQVLGLIRERLGCGYIKRNSRRDQALVFVVRRRRDLLDQVIPFFERNPMLSTKHADFEKFAVVVRELELGHHSTEDGFRRLLDIALSMNGGGRFRKVPWDELVAVQNPQRLHARQGR